jgi:hypothetical protein
MFFSASSQKKLDVAGGKGIRALGTGVTLSIPKHLRSRAQK